MLPRDLQPTALELAAAIVVGHEPADPLPAVPPDLTPLEALEEAMVPALEAGAASSRSPAAATPRPC